MREREWERGHVKKREREMSQTRICRKINSFANMYI